MTKQPNGGSAANGKKIVSKVLHVLGIVLCVLLLAVLLFNCILIVDGMVHPNQVPSIGNYSPLIVLTESMHPQIKAGDLIICRHVSSEDAKTLVVGTVISFYDPDESSSEVVTHQIIEVLTDEQGNVSYVTKGINNNIQDMFPVPSQNVIGVYSGIRFAFVGSVVMFAQSPVGLALFIAVPMLIFVAFVVFDRKKTAKVQNNQELNQSLQEVERLRAEVESLRSQQTSATEGETVQSETDTNTAEQSQPSQSDKQN